VTNKADMIVDLQFGSTGKGLIAGYLAMRNEYDTVINANMPNAGHTFIDHNGHKMVNKVLPNGVVSPECDWALIGPGSVFDPNRLIEELNILAEGGYNEFMVGIHPAAVVLTDNHKDYEKKFVTIGSTSQGSAAAMIHKINRNPKDDPTAAARIDQHFHDRIVVVSRNKYRNIIRLSERILLEGAQGFSLGINQEFYPYCTSRECTPARFMSDMGVPMKYLRKVIGTARVHPIRVGSPPGGYSGGWYKDQLELDWGQFNVEPERTTVTNRIRRIATWSNTQIRDAVWECEPDEIFLNFCNYAQDGELEEVRATAGHLIKYEGWGPTVDDVMEIYHG